MSAQSGPVAGTVTTPGLARRGGNRWGAALLVMAVVIGALGVIGTLVSTPTPPEAITYVPAGSALVVEVRPDLPGDQREALGTMLARLPGFADAASLNDRIGAALDKVVSQATDGKHTYTGDLHPYAAGAVVIAVPGTLPDGTAGAGAQRRGLAVLTTEGSPGCVPLEEGRTVTIERYGDTDIRTSDLGTAPATSKAACAAAGRFVVLGDPDSVRAALDARAQGRNVGGDATYVAAFHALTGDEAARVYVNGHAAVALASAAPLPSGMTRPAMTGDVPEWLGLQLRFTDQGPVVETAMPDPRGTLLGASSPAPGGTPASDTISVIAPALPASTIAVVEAHQVGPLLAAMQARQSAAAPVPTGSAAPPLGATLDLVGDAGKLLGGLDQAALVVVPDGSSVSAGLVVHVPNADQARAAIDQLRAVAGLLGGGPATDQDYHGTRITSIALRGLASLGGSLAGSLPGSLSGALGSPRPSASTGSATQPALLADARLEIAVYGNLVILGLGDALAKAVIDTPAGSGLADQADYKAAVGAAGSPNLGVAYVNLRALVAVQPTGQSATEASRLAAARPYLEAFGAVAVAVTSGDGLLRTRFVVLP